jgi:hypothetical protein
MSVLRENLARLSGAVRRTAPGPILVRGGVYASALLALLLAWPAEIVTGRGFLVLIAVAALPVLAPRSLVVTLVILVAVAGWLAATTAFGEPLTYLRLVPLAAALYLVHTLSALAAVLPYDATVSPGVLTGWLARAGIVVLLTAALALFAVAIPVYLGDARYLAASLVGLVMMAALAGYLARLVRRG